MSIKEELKEEVKCMWKILIFAKNSFLYAKYLAMPPETEQTYLSHSRFFIHVRRVMIRITVLELYKFFKKSSNNDVNVEKLIDNLKPQGIYGSLNFPFEIIEELESELKKKRDFLKNLFAYRNKLIAHHEDKFEMPSVPFQEIEGLIIFLENIITKINLKVFDTASSFKTIDYVVQDLDFVKILVENQRKEINELLISRATIEES